jgi:hypothetical protein
MRKPILLISFFITLVCVLIISLFFFSFQTKNSKIAKKGTVKFFPKTRLIYAALPTTQVQFAGNVTVDDVRVGRLENVFQLYGSVLKSFSSVIVSSADLYGLDYRLLPAIALEESKGCLYGVGDTHNCWGWGAYNNHILDFPDYQTAIVSITKSLAKNYKNKGLSTPEEIAKIYAPDNATDWADKIIYFMNLF